MEHLNLIKKLEEGNLYIYSNLKDREIYRRSRWEQEENVKSLFNDQTKREKFETLAEITYKKIKKIKNHIKERKSYMIPSKCPIRSSYFGNKINNQPITYVSKLEDRYISSQYFVNYKNLKDKYKRYYDYLRDFKNIKEPFGNYLQVYECYSELPKILFNDYDLTNRNVCGFNSKRSGYKQLRYSLTVEERYEWNIRHRIFVRFHEREHKKKRENVFLVEYGKIKAIYLGEFFHDIVNLFEEQHITTKINRKTISHYYFEKLKIKMERLLSLVFKNNKIKNNKLRILKEQKIKLKDNILNRLYYPEKFKIVNNLEISSSPSNSQAATLVPDLLRFKSKGPKTRRPTRIAHLEAKERKRFNEERNKKKYLELSLKSKKEKKKERKKEGFKKKKKNLFFKGKKYNYWDDEESILGDKFSIDIFLSFVFIYLYILWSKIYNFCKNIFKFLFRRKSRISLLIQLRTAETHCHPNTLVLTPKRRTFLFLISSCHYKKTKAHFKLFILKSTQFWRFYSGSSYFYNYLNYYIDSILNYRYNPNGKLMEIKYCYRNCIGYI